MAGGGKRGEASSLLLVTLLVTLLAFFATNSSAARVTPRPQSLARAALSALGARQDEPCCRCACPLIYPPTWCICGGIWQGSCPSACNNCQCVLNECTCLDLMDPKVCVANSCPWRDAAPKVEPAQQWAIEETGGKLAMMV
ncbi:Bowman-Birk type proteinase inhibitor-like [Musa acuminata AAA Group]|uniref:Bowman-Birk type proteinase inhibitor-like n=1 Tax=Musa acuminata AAA Group TaxID=214697 RepID=UPI0031D00F41